MNRKPSWLNAQGLIGIASAVLVLFLAGSAFVLSYDSLRWLADASGVRGFLSYLWPLTLDAFMIAVSLAVLRNSLVSERTWYQWLLVGAFTIASVFFNVIHAKYSQLDTGARGLIAQAVYGLPPFVVFLAFELLVSQISSAVKRGNASVQLQVELGEALGEARDALADANARAGRIASEFQAKLTASDVIARQVAVNAQARLAELQSLLDVARRESAVLNAARVDVQVQLDDARNQLALAQSELHAERENSRNRNGAGGGKRRVDLAQLHALGIEHTDWQNVQLAEALAVDPATIGRNLEKAGLHRNGDGLLHAIVTSDCDGQ